MNRKLVVQLPRMKNAISRYECVLELSCSVVILQEGREKRRSRQVDLNPFWIRAHVHDKKTTPDLNDLHF